jgi:hypothetical protein
MILNPNYFNFVRFYVFTAVTMNNAHVALCRSCVNRRFGGTYGSDTFLRNVVSHKIYTAPHPRRRHSSLF